VSALDARAQQSGGEADGERLGERLRGGDRAAAPAVLNLVEGDSDRDREQTARLLRAVAPAALGGEARAHVVGVTGPPGSGKSSLLSELVAGWRAREQAVAVLAVDPSSRRSGGALLGDRARIAHDPRDRDVFIRSTAAGERLGGLAPATRAAAAALAAAFDIVVIETVGVGQSETEVADVADTVVVVVQPGSGDVLQFLKAGIMEIPDILVVTKTDLGSVAARAQRDLRTALGALGAQETPVLAVSSIAPAQGIDELIDAIAAHQQRSDVAARRLRARRHHALADYAWQHGAAGVRRLGGRRMAERLLADQDPGLDIPALVEVLERAART